MKIWSFVPVFGRFNIGNKIDLLKLRFLSMRFSRILRLIAANLLIFSKWYFCTSQTSFRWIFFIVISGSIVLLFYCWLLIKKRHLDFKRGMKIHLFWCLRNLFLFIIYFKILLLYLLFLVLVKLIELIFKIIFVKICFIIFRIKIIFI